jgi:hypothetical protein
MELSEDTAMKRILVTAALLIGSVLAAQARPVNAYYDLIRPNGHPRSDAIHQADLDYCYAKTGASRYRLDNAAMKQCMLGRGYRFMWGRNVPDQRYAAPSDDVAYPDPVPVAPDPPSPPPPSPAYDPNSGMPYPGNPW